MKKLLPVFISFCFGMIISCQNNKAPLPLCTISGINPAIGVVGTPVTISGNNFSTVPANNVIKFNGTAATVTASTATSITTTVPSGATTGPVSVAKDEHAAISSSNFTVVTPDAILGFSPAGGIVGTTVTITGTNFDQVPGNNVVRFNGKIAVVTASTTTSITTTVPSGATSGVIAVTVDGVTTAISTNTFVVIPAISSFSPGGGYGGATTVVITGTGFDPTPSNNTVKFNGLSASVSASTATTITTQVPAGATTGTITVTVGGQTAISSSNFNILIPTLTNISPTSAQKNTSIVITGTNFDVTPSNNQVTINGKTATVTSATETQLTVTVPQGAGSGPVALTVDGTAATGGPIQFTYLLTYTPTILAGNDGGGYQEGTGAGATFESLSGIAVDGQGMVYVSDMSRIRKITPQGVTSLFAGDGSDSYLEGTGASAELDHPAGIVIDGQGNVVTADCFNNRIRTITPQGVTSLLAGNSTPEPSANFHYPFSLAFDTHGYLYTGEINPDIIAKISPDGTTNLLAGNYNESYQEGTGSAAEFNGPYGLAIDSQGNVYVADRFNNRIRVITPLGATSTFAGSGTKAYLEGTGTGASFYYPSGLVFDNLGNLLVADYGNNAIRMITPDGVTSKLATVINCLGLALDTQGNIYVIGGTNNNTVIKIVVD